MLETCSQLHNRSVIYFNPAQCIVQDFFYSRLLFYPFHLNYCQLFKKSIQNLHN